MLSLAVDKASTDLAGAAEELLPLVNDLSQRMALSSGIPLDVGTVLGQLAARLPEPTSVWAVPAVDPYLVDSLTYGMMLCYRALTLPRAERRIELRIGLEHCRQALAYILEEAPVAEDRPAGEIARWLIEALESGHADIAEVLGVSARTLQRWSAGTSTPAGPEVARLRLVARLVNNLRHAMTSTGALLWLREPHVDLDGRAPAALLDEPGAYLMLLQLAARTRSQTGA